MIENNFPKPPVMQKIRWKMMAEMAANYNDWAKGQYEEPVRLPVGPFRSNCMDEILHLRVAHSSLESHAHTANSIKRGGKANSLFSFAEESRNLLGFALRSDLVNFAHRGKIEVNGWIGSHSCRVQMKEEEQILKLFSRQRTSLPSL